MKSIVASNKKVKIIETKIPEIKTSYVLIKTLYSAISPGTELGMIENSADKEYAIGYSAVGTVVDFAETCEGFQKGDIVACYGAPYVHHAEYLLVPKTLCAKVPENVSTEEASLCGLGAIAIHALRIANLQFGETVVVVGLGVLGQLIAKIADAAAYNVIAYDLSDERSEMLENIASFSTIENMENALYQSTNNHGADAVLLCAGGKRSVLTKQCLGWIRNKGKVVIVGDIEPDFPRDLMFGKEAQILISRAGGPGRYDKIYEQQAIDYPYGFIRWTEGRNIGEYLRLVNEKRIDVQPFIKEKVFFSEATEVFESLLNKRSTILTKLIDYSN
ncbi:zinc-binding alcohol dehydrogenase [Lederbergia wuyishanensis]|uniref:Threonine dehydrogenase-like Zn-dependent dehydrogenase n=1 Tax=Lederbergia wuyishanensis TaxID=1347903 RepID=A0ABU0D7V7_9BACI|nr:zinc-binding alcohol dehydrogenase [Lederbergia wuyishanensis]MCJ8009089.1 zinc-binding alcohol dehydrogenase [Lederbergia wuyishanensis]MDQ0344426.1 threonine dehydrogenase-like Zn-dependent dehydrogenase [Lederbergia wuyishanensis]